VFEADMLAGLTEGLGQGAGRCRYDALDANAEAGIAGEGRLQEAVGADLTLIREDLSEGDARGVDGDMDELPVDATAVALAAAIAGDAVADGSNRPSLEEFSQPLAFVRSAALVGPVPGHSTGSA
jgi:hypothetical protein